MHSTAAFHYGYGTALKVGFSWQLVGEGIVGVLVVPSVVVVAETPVVVVVVVVVVVTAAAAQYLVQDGSSVGCQSVVEAWLAVASVRTNAAASVVASEVVPAVVAPAIVTGKD